MITCSRSSSTVNNPSFFGVINVAPPAKNGVDRIIDLVPDVMDKIESIANTNKKTD